MTLTQRTKAPVTALVITKNEEQAIARCLDALEFCDQILVIDSGSTDRTVALAQERGHQVIDFSWNGHYPKKKQWGMNRAEIRNDWVLHLDGDEIVPHELAQEISAAVNRDDAVAYEIPIAYYFTGRRLKHGHRVKKRSLVDRRYTYFPEIDDLDAPGITEVEGHYQPVADGPVRGLSARLTHDDPDPISDWIGRHNRYSDWEAHLRSDSRTRTAVREQRTAGGQLFDQVPFKPLVFFIYSYILRLGFLDGRPGFDYAASLTWYYWTISTKVRDSRRRHE